jgi:hypothetical protein
VLRRVNVSCSTTAEQEFCDAVRCRFEGSRCRFAGLERRDPRWCLAKRDETAAWWFAARLEETVRLRDVLMTQGAWDERHGRGEGESRVTVAGICALLFNDAVPARRRLSDIDWIMRLSRLQGTSKRELRKLLFRQWKELGLRWTEDLVFPSIDRFKWALGQLMAAYKQIEAEDSPP